MRSRPPIHFVASSISSLADALDLRFRWHAPGVVGFVVDDEDVLRRVAMSPSTSRDVGFVALGSALVDAALLPDLLLGLPIQCVPVADEHLALAERFEQAGRDDVEFVVVVSGCAGSEHRQAIPDRQSGATTRMFFEKRVSCGYVTLLRTCQAISIAITMVLPEPVAILAHKRRKLPAVAGNLDADLARRPALRSARSGFRSLRAGRRRSAESRLLRVVPVLEKPLA